MDVTNGLLYDEYEFLSSSARLLGIGERDVYKYVFPRDI
jgi:hypothetical protein